MKQKKVILFDWGGIVEAHKTGYSCRTAWQDLFIKCGYEGDGEIFGNLGKYRLGARRNMQELENAYNEIAKDFKLNKSFEEFLTLYKEIFDKVDYYKDVALYEVSLRDRCFIGILSNIMVIDKKRLDNQINLRNYDYAFLSFEMGLRKPEKEIFLEVQKELAIESSNILFIDDIKYNVDAALSCGWNAYQITGLELDKIKEVCEDFLRK